MVLAAAGLLAQAQDVWPTKGWTSATPEWQGMDSGALDALVEFGRANQTDGLLVTRHGRIVLDAYYAPFEDNQLHAINSATKAITAALVGIAIARRELPPPDTPVLELATKRMVANVDERKRALKLQNLLGMDSGIAWIEPLAASPHDARTRRRIPLREWLVDAARPRRLHGRGLLVNTRGYEARFIAESVN